MMILSFQYENQVVTLSFQYESVVIQYVKGRFCNLAANQRRKA